MATPRRAQADEAIRRMERRATLLGATDEFAECVYAERVGTAPNGKPIMRRLPRWKISERWIEFECGCTAERHRELLDVRSFDPVIFQGLPEQAVYVLCCHLHEPKMNERLGTRSPYVDFDQWYRHRYRRLTGKAGA